MQSRQQGFTLVELIVVIVILGILAATALPKFISLGADARAGVLRGAQAAMRGANTMLYGKAAAAGKQNELSYSVTTNGATVALKYGYAADATELAKVMDLTPASDFTVVAGSITHKGAADGTKCVVAYTAPTAANLTPDYETGTLLTDCN